ncbi:hypothetical protein POTOM_057449 [Populus tomentosa]|uniref:Uncharacterized protein n=1 Tax=Populus tomentosa TaxID=118781 RepID=A0A8X8C1S0_POPTO|nr:hypothetical protein POTOM_057449 [Populus tomentosa]
MPEANTERREQDGDEDLAADLTTTWHFLSAKFAKADDSNLTVFVKDMAPPKVYLFDEIAKHKKTEDCWPNISGECEIQDENFDLLWKLALQPVSAQARENKNNLQRIDRTYTS